CLWIHLEVHEQVLCLWVYFHAGEVLQPSEGKVVLERLLGDVVTQRLAEGFHLCVEVSQFGGRLLEVLAYGLRRCAARSCGRRTGCRWRVVRRGSVDSGTSEEFQRKQVTTKVAVPDEFDAAVHLLDGMLVIAGEAAGDADQPGIPPVDRT